MKKPPVLQTLQDLYFAIDTNFNRLLAACASESEKDQLRADYTAARDAFWAARERVFNENDPALSNTLSELSGTKGKIDDGLAALQLTADTLKLITAAAKLATTVVAAV